MRKAITEVIEKIEAAEKLQREKAAALRTQLKENTNKVADLTAKIATAEDPKTYADLIAEKAETSKKIEYLTKACGEKPAPAITPEEYTELNAIIEKEETALKIERAPAILEALTDLIKLMNDYSIEYEIISATAVRLNRQAKQFRSVKTPGCISDNVPADAKKAFDAFLIAYFNNVDLFKSLQK